MGMSIPLLRCLCDHSPRNLNEQKQHNSSRMYCEGLASDQKWFCDSNCHFTTAYIPLLLFSVPFAGILQNSYHRCDILTESNRKKGYIWLGSKSMYVSNLGTSGIQSSSTFLAAPGESYTFSAYVRCSSGAVKLMLRGSDGITARSDSAGGTDMGWQRLEATYTNKGTASQMVTISIFSEMNSGSAYIDCVQLERGNAAGSYNIIENGDFRFGANSWIMSEKCDSNETTVTPTGGTAPAPALNNTVFQIVGDPQSKLRIRQEVAISGKQGDAFVLAGWGKAYGVPLNPYAPDGADTSGEAYPDNLNNRRNFTVRGTFLYSDDVNDRTEYNFDFNSSTDGIWQQAAGLMIAEKDYIGIKIQVLYDFNANTAYLDGIQLYKEEFGESYTYDANGNVTSVRDIIGQTTKYTYNDKQELKKTELPSGVIISNTYDNYHNVKTSTETLGDTTITTTSYTYDEYGNLTHTQITGGGLTQITSAVYRNNGTRLDRTVDAAGKTTYYGYDNNTNLLNWVKYPGMNHHIVLNLFRTQHQKAVEAEISLCATASPAGSLAADGDTATVHSHPPRKLPYLHRQHFRRFFCQSVPFRLRKRPHCRSFPDFFQMLPDPCFLADHKPLRFPFAACFRAANLHFPAGFDDDGNGFSF